MILLPLLVLWARRPLHFTRINRWLLFAVACAGLWCLGPAHYGAVKAQAEVTQPNASDKHREGTRVTGLVGTFEPAGRRWTFVADSGDQAYVVLENQSLERIAKAIDEDPQDRHWKVSGELTEYFDENFLLIDRLERAVKNADQ